MTSSINRSLLLPLNGKDLFYIIKNISNYPNFIPYVYDVEIHRETTHETLASLKVKRGAIRHYLTTKNTTTTPLKINFELVEGPMENLNGYWRVTELSPAASKVEFSIQFKLNTVLRKLGFQSLIEQSTDEIISAFELHAKQSLQPA